MSLVRLGALSRGMLPPAAMAAPDKPRASMKPKRIFFICLTLRIGSVGSVGLEGDTAGHRLEFADAAPPRHQQEEAKVEQRADLGNALADRRRRLHPEVTQDQEVDHEHRVEPLVPARAV